MRRLLMHVSKILNNHFWLTGKWKLSWMKIVEDISYRSPETDACYETFGALVRSTNSNITILSSFSWTSCTDLQDVIWKQESFKLQGSFQLQYFYVVSLVEFEVLTSFKLKLNGKTWNLRDVQLYMSFTLSLNSIICTSYR